MPFYLIRFLAMTGVSYYTVLRYIILCFAMFMAMPCVTLSCCYMPCYHMLPCALRIKISAHHSKTRNNRQFPPGSSLATRCYFIVCHVIQSHAMLCHSGLCDNKLFFDIILYDILCYAFLCCPLLCFAICISMLYHAMPYHTIPYHTMPCHAIPCYCM